MTSVSGTTAAVPVAHSAAQVSQRTSVPAKVLLCGPNRSQLSEDDWRKRLQKEPPGTRKRSVVVTQVPATQAVQPMHIPAEWVLEAGECLSKDATNLYARMLRHFAENQSDLRALSFVASRPPPNSAAKKLRVVNALVTLAEFATELNVHGEISTYATFFHPVKNVFSQIACGNAAWVVYDTTSPHDSSRPDASIIVPKPGAVIPQAAFLEEVEVKQLPAWDSIDSFDWRTHKDWDKMLDEAIAALKWGWVKHIIRSLVLVDRKTGDVRLSYWKLLAKQADEPDRDGRRDVIGFELRCLFNERLELPLGYWRPAVLLERACQIWEIQTALGEYAVALREELREEIIVKLVQVASIDSPLHYESSGVSAVLSAGEGKKQLTRHREMFAGAVEELCKTNSDIRITDPEWAQTKEVYLHDRWSTFVVDKVELGEKRGVLVFKTFEERPKCVALYEAERDLTIRVNKTLGGVIVAMPHMDSIMIETVYGFAMEKGTTFNNVLSTEDVANLKRAYPNPWQLVYDLLAILMVFQAAHVVHGDFKPSNLVISPSLRRVVAIDFGGSALGTCLRVDEAGFPVVQVHARDVRALTEAFMAPELDSRQTSILTSACDVFSAYRTLEAMLVAYADAGAQLLALLAPMQHDDPQQRVTAAVMYQRLLDADTDSDVVTANRKRFDELLAGITDQAKIQTPLPASRSGAVDLNPHSGSTPSNEFDGMKYNRTTQEFVLAELAVDGGGLKYRFLKGNNRMWQVIPFQDIEQVNQGHDHFDIATSKRSPPGCSFSIVLKASAAEDIEDPKPILFSVVWEKDCSTIVKQVERRINLRRGSQAKNLSKPS